VVPVFVSNATNTGPNSSTGSGPDICTHSSADSSTDDSFINGPRINFVSSTDNSCNINTHISSDCSANNNSDSRTAAITLGLLACLWSYPRLW
jgi:hypothetical protein